MTDRDPFDALDDPEGDTSEEANVPVQTYLTETGKAHLDKAAKATGFSKSSLLRTAWQEFAATLADADPSAFSAAHMTYFSAYRKQRDKQVYTRLATFRRRVDDVITNRLNWDTEPEIVAHAVESFRDELRLQREAGYLTTSTYENRLRYLHSQFGDYVPAQEQSHSNREDRSAAFSMAGPKLAEEFRDEIGFAVHNVLAACDGIGTRIDSGKFQAGKNYSDKAASMACAPPDKTELDVWREVKERAVEADDTFCDTPCLLDQAAEALAVGNERGARATCEKAADIYPNEHDLSTEDMMERARSRADAPEVEPREPTPSTDPATEALAEVEAEIQSIDADATGEVASPTAPLSPEAGAPALADADGGRIDGEGHDDEQQSE